MSVEAFFAHVIAALERAGIPYMVTGSVASSAHGVVRSTRDVDIVVAPTAQQLRELIASFPNDKYYADEEDALDALRHRSQFNIIDFGSMWKADLIIRKQREFSETEFSRRRTHVIQGVRVSIATAEDIVIAKLEWAKIGESSRQVEDAAGIIATQGADLDTSYVERWVRQLGLEQQWMAARAIATE
ncbi:MAG TPA: hypothetical protein VF618_15375 [Thermoanaerobaculia bacterium]